jgi:hypothetical protein
MQTQYKSTSVEFLHHLDLCWSILYMFVQGLNYFNIFNITKSVPVTLDVIHVQVWFEP